MWKNIKLFYGKLLIKSVFNFIMYCLIYLVWLKLKLECLCCLLWCYVLLFLFCKCLVWEMRCLMYYIFLFLLVSNGKFGVGLVMFYCIFLLCILFLIYFGGGNLGVILNSVLVVLDWLSCLWCLWLFLELVNIGLKVWILEVYLVLFMFWLGICGFLVSVFFNWVYLF